MNTTPMYYHDGIYAREHGEIESLRASNIANAHCRAAIEQAISRNFDGCRLNRKCLDEVLAEYTLERVLFVLSATVDAKNWDGRFSRDNKAWATDLQQRVWCPYHTPSPTFDPRDAFVVQTHPAVLDGFVNLSRQAAAKQQ